MWCYRPAVERALRVPRGILVTLCLVLVGTSGCIQGGSDEAGGYEPRSIYITDAPVEVDRLDVGIAYVSVGGVPLEVAASSFDLASLQGPDDALLLATGRAPAGADQPVEISFSWARATVGNETVAVEVGSSVRIDGPSPEADLLVDIDLPGSLSQDEGGLRFEPSVKEVYVLDAAAAPGDLSWVPASQGASSTGSGLPSAGDPDDPTEQVPEAEVPLPDSPVGASAAGEAVGWLVTFQEGLKKEQMDQMSKQSGLVYVFSLDSLPVAYVLGTELQVKDLLSKRGVERAEREAALSFHDAESRLALRMPELAHPLTGLRDAAGNPIDGRGVGIAVVDTGIHAAHADLLYEPLWSAGRVAMNLKVESQTFTDLPSTDTTSGHGTHVAGIISGQGSSDPDRRGIAPGATLYGLGVGEASTIVWAAAAFDWILENHDQVDPPIKAVTNSWSSGTDYNPDSALTRLVNLMVQKDLVVVFSASNNGGDGSTAETSAQCQIPTPGVICVAAYDDQDTGTRDGKIASYSSRGLISNPDTWPDLSAPGTNVLSTRPPVGATTGFGTNLGYVELSGTSQAAPHVTGVVALMLQADPTLQPLEVEAHLKATAYKFSHGGSYTDGSHYAKGHGLVDAYAAVNAVS